MFLIIGLIIEIFAITIFLILAALFYLLMGFTFWIEYADMLFWGFLAFFVAWRMNGMHWQPSLVIAILVGLAFIAIFKLSEAGRYILTFAASYVWADFLVHLFVSSPVTPSTGEKIFCVIICAFIMFRIFCTEWAIERCVNILAAVLIAFGYLAVWQNWYALQHPLHYWVIYIGIFSYCLTCHEHAARREDKNFESFLPTLPPSA